MPRFQGLVRSVWLKLSFWRNQRSVRFNSQSANRAVLELNTRATKQLADMSTVAQNYDAGYRYDDNGNIIRDKNGVAVKATELPTIGGLRSTMQTYLKVHPELTKEQIDHYHDLFEKDND